MKRFFLVALLFSIPTILLGARVHKVEATSSGPNAQIRQEATHYLLVLLLAQQNGVLVETQPGQSLRYEATRASQFEEEDKVFLQEVADFTNEYIYLSRKFHEKGESSFQQEKEVDLTGVLAKYPHVAHFLQIVEMASASPEWRREVTNEQFWGRQGISPKLIGARLLCGWFGNDIPSSAPSYGSPINTGSLTARQWLWNHGYYPGINLIPGLRGAGYTHPQTWWSRVVWCRLNSYRDNGSDNGHPRGHTVRLQVYNGSNPPGEPNPDLFWYWWGFPYREWPLYVLYWHARH